MLPKIFNVYEQELSDKIQNGEAPFLGLFEDAFVGAKSEFVENIIKSSPNPYETFYYGLNTFPAICSIFMISFLVKGFGDTGHFEVYSHIEKAFGKKLPNSEKEIFGNGSEKPASIWDCLYLQRRLAPIIWLMSICNKRVCR